jgi:ATP-dependent Clp protease ATP-binding subunit ClpA
VKQIAQIYLDKTGRQMKSQGKSFETTDQALALITEKGFSMQYGARFLKRFIDERVKLPITTMWKSGSHFIVDVEDGEVVTKLADVPDVNAG